MEDLLKIENFIKSMIFIHALFIFFGAMGKGNTQLRDLLNLSISKESLSDMKLVDVCKSTYPDGVPEEEQICFGKLILNGYMLVHIMKIFAWLPLLCYVASFSFLFIPENSFKVDVDLKGAATPVFFFAFGIQVAYLIVKAITGIPEIL
ncbi:MAG: hypothetical protein ACE5H1_06035, partial [Thermodesulfobacteriota bacterium]